MLNDARVATRLPAQDLARARKFSCEKLGLDPSEERPGGLLYRAGSCEFALFQSAGASPGTFAQMGWEVEDIEATVAELRARGVVFEEVDLPGLKTIDGIAAVEGNYPSKGGKGERAAWFRDREGNMLGSGQPIYLNCDRSPSPARRRMHSSRMRTAPRTAAEAAIKRGCVVQVRWYRPVASRFVQRKP